MPELYEMSKDIGEKNNVAGEKPEMVDKLNKAWDDWNTTLPPAFVPPKPAPPKSNPAKPN
jgi:hypothetical protein